MLVLVNELVPSARGWADESARLLLITPRFEEIATPNLNGRQNARPS